MTQSAEWDLLSLSANPKHPTHCILQMVIPESQKGSHPANMVSTLKYGLLKDVLRMGYHVLVADMDLIFLDNPFNHLYRDSDIESQTDGFEAGWCVPVLGWGSLR